MSFLMPKPKLPPPPPKPPSISEELSAQQAQVATKATNGGTFITGAQGPVSTTGGKSLLGQ